MVTNNGATAGLICKSTDTKPITDIDINTLLLEVDTGDFYYFDGEVGDEWKNVGGGE